jgi:putative transposase
MKRREELVKLSFKNLSIRHKSVLLSIARSQIYYTPKLIDGHDVTLMNEIRHIYEMRPFQGYKRITDDLKEAGYTINHKRVYRLMKLMGLKAVYPKMNLSKRRQADAVFPYLLKKDPPLKPHDCWNVDITYIKTEKGFVYLTAIIDAYSRCIMGWHLSNTLDTQSCLMALDKALASGYKPRIMNSDQGCQFTSEDWVWDLVKHRIEISMDGKGRWADNIQIERFWRTLKYEEVYLKSYESIGEARIAIGHYIQWYNHERRHSGIEKKRPFDIMTGKDQLGKIYGNVDNANALTHHSINSTRTKKQKKKHNRDRKLSSQIAA